MCNANKKFYYTHSYNLHYWFFLLSLLLLLFFLVQLNNRVFILSILFAAIMVNYATAIPLTADSSELLWGYPKKLSQNSLLLRSL